MLCGGPVDMMVSIPCSLIYCDKKATEGVTQETRASGIKKLPLTNRINRSNKLGLFS